MGSPDATKRCGFVTITARPKGKPMLRTCKKQRLQSVVIVAIASATVLALFGPTSVRNAYATDQEIEVNGGLRGDHIAARVRVGTPPSTSDDCKWSKTKWTSTIPAQYPMFHNATPPEDIGYDAYIKVCTEPRKEFSLHWIHDSVFSTIGKIAENAVDRLIPKPAINFAPAIDRNVVNIGSWFWIDKSAWKTISVTAYVPTKVGTLSATTSATPKKVIFSPGDGRLGSGDVTCSGPGPVWKRQNGDTSKSSCMYTYRHASHGQRGGVFNAKISIEWDIKVRMSLGSSRIGISGRVASTRTSTAIPIRVREIQSLTR
jgi:hypothetical protein